ncbi:MAG TPA: type II secretion system F family protein [Polyangiaceae bacterium]|jgi:tight adherence protein C|nr:type II secretion system F family protein [Polyangiaceae bacterium]
MALDRIWVLVLACLATAGATFTFGQLLGSTASASSRRLGLRGLKRQRALDTVTGWRLLEPALRWLGARLGPLLPDGLRQRLEREMALAGDVLGLLPEELLALSALSAALGLGLGALLGHTSQLGDAVALAGLCAGAALPRLRIDSAAARRKKEVTRRLPHAIDLLALSMGAGSDFPGAVRQLLEKSPNPNDPLIEELTLLLQSLQLGRTRRRALEEFAARVPSEAVVEFVGAVVQAELRGSPLVEVLRIQAEVSRRKRSVRAEELAAKAGVAMMGPLVLVFLAILLVIVAPMVLRLQSNGL